MCNGLASACIYRERSSRYGEKDQATEFLHTLSLEYFDRRNPHGAGEKVILTTAKQPKLGKFSVPSGGVAAASARHPWGGSSCDAAPNVFAAPNAENFAE